MSNNNIMTEYNKILLTLLTINNQIRLYHWQTLLHPRHLASGELYSNFDELVDKFIEALQGRIALETQNANFRIMLNNKFNKINLQNYNDSDGILLLSNVKVYLESNELLAVINNYSDLLNIRDEMLALVNKTIYLFTLK